MLPHVVASDPSVVNDAAEPGLQAALGASTAPDLSRALAEAAGRALECLGAEPTAALVALSSGLASPGTGLARQAVSCLGIEAVVGCSAAALRAPATLGDDRASVLVAAFSGPAIEPAGVERGRDLSAAADELAAQLTIPDEDQPHGITLVFPDSHAMAGEPLCRAISSSPLSHSLVAGVACDGAQGGDATLFVGERPYEGGIVALRFDGGAQLATAHGCRMASEPVRATRTQGHWIVRIGERAALDCLREAAGAVLGGDLSSATEHVLVALGPGRAEDALLRRIVGVDEARGAVAIGATPQAGDLVSFAVRDPLIARDNLKTSLSCLPGAVNPAFGFYASCARRGAALFGEPGLELGYVAGALGGAALLAVDGPYQIASRGVGEVALHTHTGVLAVV